MREIEERLEQWLGRPRDYLVGGAIFAVAAAARAAMVPLLGSYRPYITFFPAVLFAASYGGIGPGLFVTGLSLAFTLVYLGDAEQVPPGPLVHVVGSALFVLVCLLMIGVAEAMRVSRRRAEQEAQRAHESEAMVTRAHEERSLLLERERGTRAEAERANRMKDEFLATLSHELRTPLNAISGWAQVLAQRPEEAEVVARAAESIRRSSSLQAQLIDDLLDMSRIVSGTLQLDIRPVDLAEVVRSAAEMVRSAADAKEIALVLRAEASPARVRGDAHRLEQVVLNLLSNAIKFSDKGSAVEAVLEHTGSNVALRVTDRGEGIDPAFLPVIFDRFRQADSSMTRRQGGLGLGLAIVKHLVEMHGGTVQASSPGRRAGSTFVVSLPTVPEEGTRILFQTKRQWNEVPTAERPPRLDGTRVLVVEDDPESSSFMRLILSEQGAVVQSASTAAQALELVRRFAPGVIVCDIGLPDVDGFTFMRRLREDGIDAAAVAVTAYARPEDRARALRSGFQSYLAKPVDPAELILTIGALAVLDREPGSG